MSCDHQLIAEHVCDYIENNLSPALTAGCKDALAQCPHCQAVHDQALAFYHLSRQWQQQTPPPWQRARPLLQPRGMHARPWLALSALAASLCAIALVLLQVEISTDNGLWISFGGSQTEARLQQLVADELQAHTTIQEALLQARLDDFASQQLTANQLLLARWQEANRGERRDELTFLMSGWQARRYQDQQVIGEQLTRLANTQRENNQYLNALMQAVATPQRNPL
jgi:hypothetical protein